MVKDEKHMGNNSAANNANNVWIFSTWKCFK